MDQNSQADELAPASLVVAAGRPEVVGDGALNPAIELTSTFHATGPKGYARFGNDTWSHLEAAIAALEGGPTLIFPSGMSAINTLFRVIPRGTTFIASKNGYTGTMYALRSLAESGDYQVKYVDIANTEEVLAGVDSSAFIWLESPTNPAMEVAELPTLIARAKALGAGVGVDNTFATPLLQQPLELGADVSMNSVTKFISGHSDVLMGSISTRDSEIFDKISDARKFGGAIPGPFEAWLALRGIRTLALRLERSQSNARILAERLSAHPNISRVRYPGLENDPFHERAKSFMKGFGAVLAFEINGTPEQADQITANSKLISFATSLGGVETLWERRHRWSSESPSVPKNLIRMSIGIEDVDDLWRDVNQAIATVLG